MARPAAIAAESVHPVPWVFCVPRRGAGSRSSTRPSAKKSMLSAPPACPPLTSTARAPCRSSRSAWARICVSSAAKLSSSRAAASGRLGVRIDARGNSRCRSTSTASRASSSRPVEAAITGSSTTFRSAWRSSASATASITAAVPSMPIFTAPTARSEHTASSCAVTNCGDTISTAVTPCVFCAVSAVITVAP